MKSRVFRRVLLFLSVFFILFTLLLLPISAYPLSFSDAYLFPPFHMNLVSGLWYNGDIVPIQASLPSIPYDDTSNPSFYDVSDYVTLDDTIHLEMRQLYGYDDSISGGDPVLRFDFMLESYADVNTPVFSGDTSIFFQDGYLSPGYRLGTPGDSIVFAAYSASSRDDVIPGTVIGEFSFTSDPFTPIEVYARDDQALLSYYHVVYNSNYDFLSHLPSDYDPLEWREAYSRVSDFDFSNLTPAQISTLSYLFDWLGPLYGDFEVELQYDFHEFSMTCEFFLSYVLTSRSNTDNFHEQAVEDATYSGLTGFERVTKFLGSAVQGFFSVEIMPEFSLGGIVVIIVTFSLVMWWLKVFAGG